MTFQICNLIRSLEKVTKIYDRPTFSVFSVAVLTVEALPSFQRNYVINMWIFALRFPVHFFSTPLVMTAGCNVLGARAPPPPGSRVSSFTRALDRTQRQTTVDKTPLDRRSARRRYISLPDNTRHSTTERHPCPRWDSKREFQEACGSDLHLRPHGNWKRHATFRGKWNLCCCKIFVSSGRFNQKDKRTKPE